MGKIEIWPRIHGHTSFAAKSQASPVTPCRMLSGASPSMNAAGVV